MPYDFTFKRIIELDNETALERNISLARALTASFVEVFDANPPESVFHFTKTVVDTEKEFPEQHFYLQADVDGHCYQFSFWKDHIFVELGAGGNIDKWFHHLRVYSAIILIHDFLIESPIDGKLLSTEIGFNLQMEEYSKWVEFVERVRHIHNSYG